MAYCTIENVQAHNAGRGVYSSSTKPTATQVLQFIDEAAADIDMALIDGGYTLPVDPAATAALLFLQRTNAMGALCSVETSSVVAHNQQTFCSMFKSALASISSGQRIPGLVKGSLSMPRGTVATPPFFTRDMDL